MADLTFTEPSRTGRYAKVLLIGEAGSGKTHAALTFPKCAVIDAEGSIGWFADRFDFVSVPTKSYRDVTNLIGQVRAKRVPCETLVIDSLTTIYSGLVNAASADREDLRPLDWGRIKRKFSQLLDELYHTLPVHVVCIGWVKAEYAKPGDVVGGKTIRENDMIRTGETFDGDRKAMHAFDFVFKLHAANGKHSATVLKSRSGALHEGQKIENFSWQTIKDIIPTSGAAPTPGMTDDEQIARDREPATGASTATDKKDASPTRSKRPAAKDAPESASAAETAEARFRRTVGEVYGRLGAERASKDIEVHRSVLERVAQAVGVEKAPARFTEFSQAQIDAFLAGEPAANAVAEPEAGKPAVTATAGKSVDSLLRERIAALGCSESEIQDVCGLVTLGSHLGIRYELASLTGEELEAVLAELAQHTTVPA